MSGKPRCLLGAGASWHCAALPAVPVPSKGSGVLCNAANSFPGTFHCSYCHAAATAFHFTPNCYVINHLPRVWVCFPDYTPAQALGPKPAALEEEYPLCLQGSFTMPSRLCPVVKHPFQRFTNPWLFCQLGYARGVRQISLHTRPPGEQYEKLNSSRIQHPAGKTPSTPPRLAGWEPASLVPGSMHDPCPLAMASHTVPLHLPN